MTIGGSIALIVIGAILRYAVNWSSAMRRRRSAPAHSYRIGSVYAPGSIHRVLEGIELRWGFSARSVRDE